MTLLFVPIILQILVITTIVKSNQYLLKNKMVQLWIILTVTKIFNLLLPQPSQIYLKQNHMFTIKVLLL